MTVRSLPKHQYIWVDSSFIRHDAEGFEPAIWFALRSEPGRVWGCHIMLECGAVYRDLPPHALAFSALPEPWSIDKAQMWDCYSRQFELIEYDYLSGLTARYDRSDASGTYLFTACPYGDGFSAVPTQSKEFKFLWTTGDRLAIRPTNYVLFEERSFTPREVQWPTDIKTNDTIWSCEP